MTGSKLFRCLAGILCFAVLIAAVTVTIALLAGTGGRLLQPAQSPFPSWQQGTVVRSTPTGLYRLQWRYDKDQVRYLAFIRSSDDEPPSLVSANGSMPGGQLRLSRPNQRSEDIPAGFNVFESIDGHFEQQHIPLTIDQAKAFCGAKRDAYTIKTLREFLSAR